MVGGLDELLGDDLRGSTSWRGEVNSEEEMEFGFGEETEVPPSLREVEGWGGGGGGEGPERRWGGEGKEEIRVGKTEADEVGRFREDVSS